MISEFLPYAILLLVTSVVLVALAVYAWERRERTGATPLAFFLLGETIWCLCAFAAIVTRGTVWAPFWSRAWFLGVVMTVAGLFVFALEYTGNDRYLGRRTYALLAVEPLLFLGTIAIGPEYLVHDAVRRTSENMLGWVIVPGVAFWIHSAYSYVLLVVTTALLVKFALLSDTLRRRQAVALVASILVPWFGNVLYLFTDIRLDPTPMAFSVAGLAITWAVFRGGLLDISPVAYREVVESLGTAVFVADTEGRITDVNDAGQALLRTDDVVGDNVDEAFADWPELLQHYRATSDSVSETTVEVEQQGRYFLVESARLTDDRGESVGRVVQIHEITAQKTRQLELERRNRQLDQFAAIVSHDLRNPLSVASGSMSLARQSDKDEHFDRVERAHERMRGLIDQVLALTRDDEDLVTAPQSLAELAQTAWAHVDTGEATLEVDTDLLIDCNEDQLLQLFENAFRNSVEHAGENCHIRVGTVHEAPGPEPNIDGFLISDDGPGIPSDQDESVFDYGYSTDDDGTGLGLAIIERIVRSHGWSIQATESPAGGLGLVISDVTLQEPQSVETVE